STPVGVWLLFARKTASVCLPGGRFEYVMCGSSDGEYLPSTPSCSASLPFAPEYLELSYLPPSIAKWRGPTAGCGDLPTAVGSILKLVSLTLTLTVPSDVASGFGDVNATLEFGSVGVGAAVVEPALAPVESERSLSLLPQPARTTATARTKLLRS